ncbi:MAG: xanthine dehydrogenase family protein molybdopterin-binding subunit [Nitrososphaerales archaeon]
MQALQLKRAYLGSPVRCREDEHFIRGIAEYTDDVALNAPNFVAFVRSTQPHAKIVSIDTSKANSMPGVVDILTCADLKRLVEPVVGSPFTVVPGGQSIMPMTYYGFADNKVTYVGEPILAVLCSSRSIAEDALDAIEIDYEPLRAVIDPELAMAAETPLIYENWKNNIIYTLKIDEGEVDSVISKAPRIVRRKFSIPRQTIVSMEPRCCSAYYDKGKDVLTVWCSTQSPHVQRSIMARTLRIAENRIRVIARDVGGAFGLKNSPFIETIVSALFALRSGYPVKWTETRTESISTFQAREQLHDITAGVDLMGKILALKARVIANHGAYYATPGTKSILNTALFLPGCYDIRNYHGDLACVVTNKAPYTAYRGFGKAEASFVIERTIDAIARELGLDPAVVRFRNFIGKNDFPYVSATGQRYDSGDYERCLKMLLDAIRYDEKRRIQRRERETGRLMGIGLSVSLAPGGSVNPNSLQSGYEAAHLKIAPDGSITALSGVSSQGQSHETAIAQAVADQLSVDEAQIRVIEGDTDLCPYGLGAWSDRTSVKGIPAAMTAAQVLRNKLTIAASALLRVPVQDIEFNDGRAYSKLENAKGISFKELVWKIYTQPYLLPPNFEPGLEVVQYIATNNVRYLPDELGSFSLYPTFGYCACAVTLFVDPETGSVTFGEIAMIDDSGSVANPLIVESQLQGAAAQGVGSAMLEEVCYDKDGQIMNSTLMDYLIPTAPFSPEMKIGHLVTPSPFVKGGFKSVGEAGTIAMTPAVANAIDDALSPLKTNSLDPPFTHEKIHRACLKSVVAR